MSDIITCKFCGQETPAERIQWHHSKPKSQGGKRTIPVCVSCHRKHHSTNGDFSRWGRQGGKKTQANHPEVKRNLKQFRGKPQP